MCSESASSPHNLDRLFEGYSQVHFTCRGVIIEDAGQPMAVATTLKPPTHRWSHFLGDWFSWTLGKKNHHINGAVTLRAVERDADDTGHVCDMSHKTVLWKQLLMCRGWQNVARTALASKGLWANGRDSWSLRNRSEWQPRCLKFCFSHLPDDQECHSWGPAFPFPSSRAVLLSTAGLAM